ncbi:MAG: S8 family serine peptidase [Actinomycetota bacterium]
MRTPRPLAALLVLAGLLPAGLPPSGAAAQTPTALTYMRMPEPEPSKERPTPRRDADTVLVKFKPNTTKTAQGDALEQYGAHDAGTTGTTGYTVAAIEDGDTPEATVAELRQDSRVDRVQLNYLRWAAATPNDPGLALGDQEYLKRIRSLAAWNRNKGTSLKTIAILDTGIDTDHPDLASRIKPGYNAITGGTDVEDDNAHGTFVAGIAAAISNNGRGIASAAWAAGILPVKVLDSEGVGTDADVAEGITWAADHGAEVINMSFGGPGESQILKDAVDYAKTKDVVLVASAGNEGWSVPSYPAAHDSVLAVTATDNSSTFAFFSNHGWWVDIAAPGVNIVSTFMGDVELYGIGSGTSFAAPLVAGVAFLVRNEYPTWNRTQVYNRVKNQARDHGPRGIDPSFGKGRLDSFAALGGGILAPVVQPAGDAFESNPTIDRAKAVTTSVSGTISPEGDVDFFYTDVTTPGQVTFTVTPPGFDPGAPRAREMDPVLAVFDPNLRLVGVVDTEFLGDPETFTAPVEVTGRYYAAVYNFFGSRTPAPYTLSVSTSTTVLPPLPLGEVAFVRDHSPADFVLNVGTAASPTVEFARDMDAATFTTSTVQLLNGKTGLPIAITRSYNATTHVLTLDPTAALLKNTPYIVSTDGVMDVDGEAMGLYRYRFKTVV